MHLKGNPPSNTSQNFHQIMCFQKHGPMKWNIIIQGSPPAYNLLWILEGNWRSTWDIPECFYDAVVFVIDDARSFALDTTAVPHFTFACPHALRGIDLDRNRYVKIHIHYFTIKGHRDLVPRNSEFHHRQRLSETRTSEKFIICKGNDDYVCSVFFSLFKLISHTHT